MKGKFLVTATIALVVTMMMYDENCSRIMQVDNTSAENRETRFKCATPEERRALVELGENGSEEQWRTMIECMLEREKELVGVFGLHVSKSGGTSLCDLFTDEKCYFREFEGSNCWERYGIIDFSPQWVREKYSSMLGLDEWMSYDDKNTSSASCADIRDYMNYKNLTAIMSENWLPNGGSVCRDDFSNVIIVRDPMKRIISHLDYVFYYCMYENESNERCSEMLQGGKFNEGGANYFNLTFMTQMFDIMTDNYYTRSLNDQSVYKEPFGMNGKGDEYPMKAVQNLHSFDWVILLESGNIDEAHNTDLILKEGLGLSEGFGLSRKQNHTKIGLMDEDYVKLKEMNKYDEQIWLEAKRLNALDVEALQKLAQFGGESWRAAGNTAKEAGSTCCGRVCS